MKNKIPVSINREHVLKLLSKGMRIDGRDLLNYRPISINFEVAGKADGSASVRFGDTYVMVGVKAEIGKPFPDTPEEGVLLVNAEFVPLASPDFEPGPPNEDAIELARVVDRGLRKGEVVDLKELCIVPGEKVWMLWVDIYILDHNGNLMDAAALASLAALMNTKLPEVKVEGEEIIKTGKFKPLNIKDYPIAVTLGKIGGSFIVDPLLDEEQLMDCRLTVITTKSGNICALQKSFSGTFSQGDVLKALNIAVEKGKELRDLLFSSFEKFSSSKA
ncbi:MAG: exosome complex protein Rrp42 [Candidatus Verstraetearchaeota archaeon]|nr:exosome complex protein Rrp42 [Candidatus Verstraetearchaeota archaeon]